MKKIFTFIFVSVLALSCWGTEVTIGSGSATTTYSPIVSGNKYSICQQMYTKIELNNAGLSTTEGITAIAFNYAATGKGGEQAVEIYLTHDVYSSFSDYFDPVTSAQKVFDGNITLPSTAGWYKIDLDTKTFVWDSKKTLLVTVVNKSSSPIAGAAHYCYNGASRQKHSESTYVSKSAPTGSSVSGTTTSNVPQIKFYFGSDSPTPTYNAPTNVSVTTTSTTATISWTKEADAKIKLQHSLKAADDWTTVNDIDAASYTITGLSPETEYEYKVSAVYEGGESVAVNGFFTTASVGHEHDGIAFLAWNETTALPTAAGSYFLKNDVTVSSWPLPTGDTKICLNGKTITITSTNKSVTVESGTSLSIYDNEGNGKVTAGLNFAATIKVNTGGTLSLYGGAIANTGTGENSSAIHVASNAGTFNLKGDVKMSTPSNAANINLQYGKITLVSALTNTAKLSVSKNANQDITSGWSTHMSSANPADYFSSKNASASAVILVGEEAQLSTPQVTISETGVNTITDNQTTNVNLVRTFVRDILNTISLPFALSDAQMQTAFGADYELYQLSSSSLSGTVLDLNFDRVTSLNATYPYLLRVSEDVVNPSFNSVTLKTGEHRTNTTAVDMIPVISEKEVVAREYNLFLNAAGELNWATTDSQFKGMRAYFQVKAEIPSSISVRRINIRNTPTDVEAIENNANVTKHIENGQLVILKNGAKYNVQGQIIK